MTSPLLEGHSNIALLHVNYHEDSFFAPSNPSKGKFYVCCLYVLESVVANVALGNTYSSIFEMMMHASSISVKARALFVSRLQFVTCLNLGKLSAFESFYYNVADHSLFYFNVQINLPFYSVLSIFAAACVTFVSPLSSFGLFLMHRGYLSPVEAICLILGEQLKGGGAIYHCCLFSLYPASGSTQKRKLCLIHD